MPARQVEHRYPCEACGANLSFAPGQTVLRCSHCGHEQAIPAATGQGAAKLREIPLAPALRSGMPPLEVEEHRVLRCTNCGAEIEVRGPEHASRCPFCATAVVTDTGSRRHIKPQGVLPFELTEAEARDALGRWLGALWFAPNGLLEYARRGRKMTGVYSPFWTFDANTRSTYSGMRGDAYYETQTVNVRVGNKTERRQTQVRKIRWRRVGGRVARAFDDVLVLASRSLPRQYTDGLKPWDLSALLPYRPDYLAGFEAEGYTVELPEGHAEAKAEMARAIEFDVRRDIGGDAQRIERLDTAYSAETFKHVLLPIWSAAYRYQGKSYRFVVNGQTGRVQGERPWSLWKIAFAVLVALIAAGVLFAVAELR